MNLTKKQTELVVIGGGPGGYTAAFRAADLGKEVTIVEYHENIGGVCLNVGCIPSKTLLHVVEVLEETRRLSELGITDFIKTKINIEKLKAYKKKIINSLTGGLKSLAKKRNINLIQGIATFVSANEIKVTKFLGEEIIKFEQAIIAIGSSSKNLPFSLDDPRLINSTDALALQDIPKQLLVIGGGITGMEIGTIYQSLGSKVSMVELTTTLLTGVDTDLVAPLQKRMSKHFTQILLNTKVTDIQARKDGLWVSFKGKDVSRREIRFDKVLFSGGRIPNGKNICAEEIGVIVNEHGFIPVDKYQRTNLKHIFAIGDVTSNPMLAHKAILSGKIAAEVTCGLKHTFEPKCIPSVAYTNPEIAWVGITEQEARDKNLVYGKGVFPWIANGRALTIGQNIGLTKIIFNKHNNQIIGAGIVGLHAGDLISELALAIETKCNATDLTLTMHPHPTLSETICQAAEAYKGSITDLYVQKK